jgi:YihY family inner membrane protein
VNRKPRRSIKSVVQKLSKDNLGALAAIVSWSIVTSLVPILVGLIAISGLILRNNPSAQQSVISHLSEALKGVLSTNELRNLVSATTHHTGLLGIIGFVGVLWGGSSVGGAISTTFQAIFEVKGRSFIVEKLIDIGMIFIFTTLMIVIILATTAGAIMQRLFSGFPLSGVTTTAIGTAISVVAAFLLFVSIYAVFPHVEPRFKLGNIWKGALAAAVIFTILSYIWPLYAHFAHFGSHGALLGAMALLLAWIYFFSMTMLIGAEAVAFGSIQEAKSQGTKVGPEPDGTVPQHTLLREQRPRQDVTAQTSSR